MVNLSPSPTRIRKKSRHETRRHCKGSRGAGSANTGKAAFVKMIEYEVEYYENGQPKKRRLKIRFRKNPPDADKAAKMLGISVSDIIGIKQVSPYPKNTFG